MASISCSARRLLVVSVLLAGAPALAGPAADDRFLEGVASAYLEVHFGLENVPLEVIDGRLWLDPADLQGADPDAVRARLSGVRGLEVVLASPPEQQGRLEVTDDLGRPLPIPAAMTGDDRLRTGFLPEQEVFEPPLADPRSPAIGGALLSYQGDDELGTVGRADFGGTLPLYGWQAGGATWQVGLEGGVFSIFDIERSPTELINADYLIALPLSARSGRFESRVRVLHQSSHLGDEILLRTGMDRVNLSYEAIDGLLAFEAVDGLRIYGGGSSLIRKSPSELDPFGLQAGLDYKSPSPLLTSLTYPVFGLDLRSFQETDWDANLSIKGGLELRNGFLSGTRVQLLAEYFNGRSPNGQFYDREIEFVGVGLRVLF
ncbi:MAG: DUF1207 domain-containing protein [Geminicoccaceae bacterium]|nr:DUF1207 domain-containing protein [Geminicoccaceae bacterium]